ncbi:formate dehydrogenase accessory sulfurtransferase FdhD [Colwellia echini]|uniref:Formate dehydrogenase accessory sulfurtransferase FdhD n=1 Tax=Colwellia echini TaxID=1982103 RepID=A0ABY3N138_9GAMM|nr:formate dehydrogenase accessory sulfurtransferase FdhD [Colwellia echini]TYK67202.1 formate dehydrogenase accessory sulfurtransferase FdhD [Colwellia echini]
MLDNSNVSENYLADEAAIAIEINGVSYAVMMATPEDITDFAIGFLFSESIINHFYDIHDIQDHASQYGLTIQITIANRCNQLLKHRVRQLKGVSGCGMCGTQALNQAFPEQSILPQSSPPQENVLTHLREKLNKWQERAKHSGAMHAAFWLDKDANIQLCREDIGRHNALDKLIGALIQEKVSPQSGILLITSRCSSELIQKTLRFGATTLMSLASPSQLAVNLASTHNLNLIHLPRHKLPIYYMP